MLANEGEEDLKMNSSPEARPDYIIRRYGPDQSVPVLATATLAESGEPPALPGDFILTHSTGIYGRLIRLGEALRYWGKENVFAHWSHAAIFINEGGDIIEALGGGVQQRNISVYKKTEYVVVHLPRTTAPLDRKQAIDFAEFCIDDKYGWLTILSIALCLLSTAKIGFQVDGQQICSGLVARSLERTGVIFAEDDPWRIMPADLAKQFNVRLTGERGKVPRPDDGVKRFSKPGGRRG
jgi:hypothetical protein